MSDESDDEICVEDEEFGTSAFTPVVPGTSSAAAVLANANDPKRHARQQHNALERRRRDNIKDMYSSLKEVINDFPNESRTSRAMILKRSIEEIEARAETFNETSAKLANALQRNAELRSRIEALEKAGENDEDPETETTDEPSTSTGLKRKISPRTTLPSEEPDVKKIILPPSTTVEAGENN